MVVAERWISSAAADTRSVTELAISDPAMASVSAISPLCLRMAPEMSCAESASVMRATSVCSRMLSWNASVEVRSASLSVAPSETIARSIRSAVPSMRPARSPPCVISDSLTARFSASSRSANASARAVTSSSVPSTRMLSSPL